TPCGTRPECGSGTYRPASTTYCPDCPDTPDRRRDERAETVARPASGFPAQGSREGVLAVPSRSCRWCPPHCARGLSRTRCGDTPGHARNAVEGGSRPGNITFVSHNILGSVYPMDTRCSV